MDVPFEVKVSLFCTSFVGHENICFGIAKFMDNEYSVKSLQRYATACEMINSWVLKTDQ